MIDCNPEYSGTLLLLFDWPCILSLNLSMWEERVVSNAYTYSRHPVFIAAAIVILIITMYKEDDMLRPTHVPRIAICSTNWHLHHKSLLFELSL